MTAPTLAEFLRDRGTADEHLDAMVRHIGDRYRGAHLHHYNVDPGDRVLSPELAGRIIGEYSVLACRNCSETSGIEDSDTGECLNCGLGVVNPADRPAASLLPATPLPISMGGPPTKKCVRCARTWGTSLYYVAHRVPGVGEGAVCRFCAWADPETQGWMVICDVGDAIDELMQLATDAKQRDLFRQKIISIANHFSGWRWPEETTPGGGQ